jgi:hypothetical protein
MIFLVERALSRRNSPALPRSSIRMRVGESGCSTLRSTNSRRGQGYSGNYPPLRDIRKGNNEFYKAGPGYDQAAGLGVLDVANLAEQFR